MLKGRFGSFWNSCVAVCCFVAFRVGWKCFAYGWV